MSKPNKVNKDRYTQRGRLTPDELARERAKQIHIAGAQRTFNERAKQERTPPAEQVSNQAKSETEEEG